VVRNVHAVFRPRMIVGIGGSNGAVACEIES